MNEQTQEDTREAIEHRDVLLAVRAILTTESGRNFFKYMFKHYSPMDLPDVGLEGPLMFEQLGVTRAGQGIFKLVAEASPDQAAQILASVEKERYDRLYREAKIGSE